MVPGKKASDRAKLALLASANDRTLARMVTGLRDQFIILM